MQIHSRQVLKRLNQRRLLGVRRKHTHSPDPIEPYEPLEDPRQPLANPMIKIVLDHAIE